MRALLMTLAVLAFAGIATAQSSLVLFEDVKLYYQKPGSTDFKDDDGLLALDGGQKVMIVTRDNKPLFILRYDNIVGMTFNEKKDKTLAIQFGGNAPAGSVRMELRGRWRQILETLQAQSGKQVQVIVTK